ncbi:MAG: DUF5915 domain-containing protein, partial [Candidatus Binatia bacterium]
GLSARNSAKMKVRQPLAEIKILPASEAERHAVLRFADQISEELNVKQVSLHDPSSGPLLKYEVKPNLKTLGPRLGERVKEVQKALAALDPAAVVKKVQTDGNFEVVSGGEALVLTQDDLLINVKAPDGWAGLTDQRTQIALDVRVTEELAREGIAREIVRHIQELRKTSGLEIEDRIHLHLQTDSATVRDAIQTHRGYICGETLAVELMSHPLNGNAHKAVIKLQGQALTIELRRVPPMAPSAGATT